MMNMFHNFVLFDSVACLAALQRHGECLALVNKRLEEETENPDLFIMRARLHELFRNVSTMNGQQDFYSINVNSVQYNVINEYSIVEF